MISLKKSLHSQLFYKLLSQGYIFFMFSEIEKLRYKTSWKSQWKQKCNDFVTIGFVVFTNFTEKVGPSNKFITTSTSVMTCMIFTLRLPKTTTVYIFYATSPISKDSILTKKVLRLFWLTFTDKVIPTNIFHKMCFYNSSLYTNINCHKIDLNIKLTQSWVYHFYVQQDNHIENLLNSE